MITYQFTGACSSPDIPSASHAGTAWVSRAFLRWELLQRPQTIRHRVHLFRDLMGSNFSGPPRRTPGEEGSASGRTGHFTGSGASERQTRRISPRVALKSSTASRRAPRPLHQTRRLRDASLSPWFLHARLKTLERG